MNNKKGQGFIKRRTVGDYIHAVDSGEITFASLKRQRNSATITDRRRAMICLAVALIEQRENMQRIAELQEALDEEDTANE